MLSSPVTSRRAEAAREAMRQRWADPARRERMLANLAKGRGWNRKPPADPPDPPAPPADPNAAPPPAAPPADPSADPPTRRNPAGAVLTASPRDLIEWLRSRR